MGGVCPLGAERRARRQSPRGTLPHNSVLLCGSLRPALCPLSLGPCPCLIPAQSLRCYSCGALSKFPSFNECPTSECNLDSIVCYTGNLTLPVGRDMIELDIRDCASSCQTPTELIKRLLDASNAKLKCGT
ncbi:LY6D [Cervus elaphus hippelaphus]|uniref:LY6D n=1 Tax=Cervus elaphus hippelaphus TaxID=46360 RepID=A0A212CED6_CEREH|nr:LY6D [Cervus elaphus hippelaphus]